jgi:ribosome modulation factor
MKTTAHRNGRFDFLMGVKLEDCPYAIGTLEREHWMAGWLERRGEERYRCAAMNDPPPISTPWLIAEAKVLTYLMRFSA